MPAKKAIVPKKKIIIESDSEDEQPIIKNKQTNNIFNFENYEFDINTFYPFRDLVDNSLQNYDMEKIKALINKIDEIKEYIYDEKNSYRRRIEEFHDEINKLLIVEDRIETLVNDINKHEEELEKKEKLEKEAKLKAKENNKNNQVVQVAQIVQEIPNNKFLQI